MRSAKRTVRRTFADKYGSIYSINICWSYDLLVPDEFTIYDGETPIGRIILGLMEAPEKIELRTLGLRQEYRHRGIGTKLLRSLLRLLRRYGAHTVYGEIMRRDTREKPWLVDWYRSIGFTIRERPDHMYKQADILYQWPDE